ncbi:uncharacterized protein LOC135468446 [Liolophura sinensis]|uniref:uncharacterized protein LOC135468446 n=1 Tax=Liolophura sinensis TaxID=3198878 RepID=UPI0031583887
MMQASHRAEFSPHHPTKQKPLLMSGPQNPPFVDSLSSQARPRKILINPHFRGPSASTAAPDTTVTWSHHPSRQRHSAPQLPQVPNPPSFPAPVHQAQYPVREQPTYNGQPQPALLAFPEPHRGPETIRGHEHHMGHDPHRGHVPLFAMGSHSAPSHPRGMPQQQAFSSGPPHSYHEQQGLYPWV